MTARTGWRALWRAFLLSLAGFAALFAASLLLMPLIMGPYGGDEPAGLIEAGYALAFALPVTGLACARVRLLTRLPDGGAPGTPRKIVAAATSVAGFALVLLLVTARSHLPDGGWGALPSPPAPLTSLVRTSPVTVLDGVVYGATADGKVLGLFCAAGSGCAWEAMRDLPPPPDLASFWQGVCDPQGGHALLWLEPPPPRRALDQFSTLICGPDYATETHFLLTEGGAVWTLRKRNPIDESILLLLRLPVAVVVTIAGMLWTEQVSGSVRERGHASGEPAGVDP